MKLKAMHKNFKLPVRSTTDAGAFDIFMPDSGYYAGEDKMVVPLGFSSEFPAGYVALLLPRSGAGFKHGIEVNNTVGVIDSDYRGEWFAAIRTKTGKPLEWKAGERLLQFMLVPVYTPDLELVNSLEDSDRGEGGIGSTGN